MILTEAIRLLVHWVLINYWLLELRIWPFGLSGPIWGNHWVTHFISEATDPIWKKKRPPCCESETHLAPTLLARLFLRLILGLGGLVSLVKDWTRRGRKGWIWSRLAGSQSYNLALHNFPSSDAPRVSCEELRGQKNRREEVSSGASPQF